MGMRTAGAVALVGTTARGTTMMDCPRVPITITHNIAEVRLTTVRVNTTTAIA